MSKKGMRINKKLLLIAFIGCFIPLLSVQELYAQDRYPREYTNPDEIVAFDKSTNYSEAIEVINQFMQEYKNKFIIDQTSTTGVIGTSLPAMHWEDAFQYILRFKRLTTKETDEYVEIITQAEANQAAGQQVSSSASGGGGGSAEGDDEVNLKTREVRIHATFFEGNKRALQEIGVDWSTLTSNVPANLNEIVAGEGPTPDVGVPQPAGFGNQQFVSVNSFNAANVSQNAFNALVNLGELGAGISVQALFSAFEADNLGEVIATPFTKVVDGKEGRIQVGQDFSIKQRDIAGNVTDEFFSTGTILTVTPAVITTNDTTFIHLTIEVERSSAQPDAVSTIINKQEASTEALLLNGEATAVAGLFRTEENKVRRGVPILKDLPPWFFGLRYLFGYNSNDYIENELVIIVQAELEKSLEERLKQMTFASQRSVLDESRQGMRDQLDRVFQNEVANKPVVIDETPVVEEQQEELVPEEEETDLTMAQDTVTVDSTTVVSQNEEPEVLSEEDEKLAEELSMPMDDPELMVVVPRAFSLDEYLDKKANGEEVEDTASDDLKYFVIGGSFLVKGNADRFTADLEERGFDTRVLFHPESRFNFVAYQGFSRFKDAVEYLRMVRTEYNSEAWLFTKR